MREQTTIGGYRLIKRIGSGGMSTVFEAEDGAGDRVALKLFHPGLLAEESGRSRLRREVAMLQKVRGPFVAEVVDAETDEAEAFIVTELVDGPTLEQDVADSGVYDGGDLADLARRLGEAVESIHRVGVLHRDLKPSNVMIGPKGPVLIDFGIAQLGEDARLTMPGSLTHTPGYCDPVVLNGGDPNPQADWWSLAAVVAFAATGRSPFGTGSAPAIMRRVLDGQPDLRGLPEATARALEAALDTDPSRRIGYSELVESLETGEFAGARQGGDSAAPARAGRHAAGLAGLAAGAGAAQALSGTRTDGASYGVAPDGATEVLNAGAGAQPADGRTEVLDGAARPSDGRTEAFGAPDPSGPPGATEVLDAGSYGGSWGAQAAGANQADAHAGHSGLQGATEVLPDAGHAPGGYTAPDGATQVLPGGSGEVQPTQVAPTGASGTPTEVLSAPVPANPAVIPPARQPAWPGQPQGQQYGPAPVQPGAYPPGWGERFGGPVPGAETEVPPWMRPAPSAWFLVALAGAVLCALAVRLPLVAVVAYSFLAFVLAVFGTAHADLNNRRLSRGGKYSGEGLGVVLRLPWVVVKCALAQFVSVAIAAVFGAGAVWGLTYLVPEQPLVATLAGGAVTFFFAWMTGTNRSARLGARELFAAIAPTASYRAFWALALLGLAAFTAVYAMEASAPDWTPLPEAPIFART